MPVPDNPEALRVIRSKGINVDLVVEKKNAPAKIADDNLTHSKAYAARDWSAAMRWCMR